MSNGDSNDLVRKLRDMGHNPPEAGALDHEELAGSKTQEDMGPYPPREPDKTVAQEVKTEAEYAVPAAVRSVGGSVGEVAGTAAGAALVKIAARHGPAMIATLVVTVGTVGCVYAAKIVSRAFGPIIGGVAAGNIATGAGLIVAALYHLHKGKL